MNLPDFQKISGAEKPQNDLEIQAIKTEPITEFFLWKKSRKQNQDTSRRF